MKIYSAVSLFSVGVLLVAGNLWAAPMTVIFPAPETAHDVRYADVIER